MFDLDRFDEARTELGQALTSDPAHVPALTLLALLELQVDNYEDALHAANAATAVEPHHAPAAMARGYALAYARRPNEAVAVAEEILSQHPDSWWHNVHYALIVRDSRNGQSALNAAWEATRQAPDEARTHLTLAYVAATLGVEDLAERAAEAAERREPGVSQLLELSNLGPRLLRGSPHQPAATRSAMRNDWDPESQAPKRPPLPTELRQALSRSAFVNVAVCLAVAICGGPSTAGVAGMLGAVGVGVGTYFIFKKLPDEIKNDLRSRVEADRMLAAAFLTLGLGIALIAGFAMLSSPPMLAGAMFCGVGTLVIAWMHSWDGSIGWRGR